MTTKDEILQRALSICKHVYQFSESFREFERTLWQELFWNASFDLIESLRDQRIAKACEVLVRLNCLLEISMDVGLAEQDDYLLMEVNSLLEILNNVRKRAKTKHSIDKRRIWERSDEIGNDE